LVRAGGRRPPKAEFSPGVAREMLVLVVGLVFLQAAQGTSQPSETFIGSSSSGILLHGESGAQRAESSGRKLRMGDARVAAERTAKVKTRSDKSSQGVTQLASDFEGSVDSAVDSAVGSLNFTHVEKTEFQEEGDEEAPSFAAGRVEGRGDAKRRSRPEDLQEQQPKNARDDDEGEGGSNKGAPARPIVVCNAYPSLDKLCVWRRGEPISSKLSYKECQELLLDASKAGDDLECRVGPAPCSNSLEDETEVQRLTLISSPVLAEGVEDTTTVLVVRREVASKRSLAFSSHIFGDAGRSAQIVLVDAFLSTGETAHGQVYIADKRNEMRFEKLDYSRDTFVHSGAYSLQLSAIPETLINKNERYEKELKVNRRLDASPGKHYVAVRVGSDEAISGERYPQDLLVFPKDWENQDNMNLHKDLSERLQGRENSGSLKGCLATWASCILGAYLVCLAL